jgi:putative FmdB family regulatory protein
MPTYEYIREDGTTFETKQSINDEPLEKCPDTGQKVKRIISGGGGVVYKGSGWYVTDYKDNDRKEKAKAETKTESESDSGESKPESTKSADSTSTEAE